MDICPCKKCIDRHAECHGKCSAYKDWRELLDEVRGQKNKEWDLKDFFTKPRYRGRRKPRV